MHGRSRAIGAVASALLALAALALSALTPAHAALLPHIDPLQAVKAMRRSSPPPPPSIGPTEQWQRYQDELAAAKEQATKQRFQNAGPWEAIAAQEFGVYAKPEAVPSHPPPPVPPAPAVPTPAPVLPTPAVHSPVHVLPIPLKVEAVSHVPQSDAHSKDASSPVAPATVAPPATASPAATAAAQTQTEKPTLSHDTVMKLIRRYTDAIAKFRADRKAEADKATRIAQAAAAWAAANPPNHHAAAPAPVAPTVPPRPIVHHRMGVPTHKLPPPPMHALHTPSAAKSKHTQFVLKFSGMCVDNHTATALGKHNDPHHRQPLRHHLKHHRGFHHSGSGAHTSSEIPWCTLKAQSQEIMTRIHPKSGVDMSVSKMVGSVARLDLFDLSVLSETEFVARGNLSFGSTRHRPHSVAMESAGSARVFKFETGSRAFTGQFEITDGSGGFEGHRGSLTLNGVLMSLNRVEALVTGVLYPPPSPPPLTSAALRAHRMSALKPSPFYRHSTPPPQKAEEKRAADDDDDDDDDGDEEDAEEVKSKAKPQAKRIHLRV